MTNARHSVLYTGVTNALQRRVYEHKHHVTKGFTHRYNCECLVYFEQFDDMRQAIAREKQIKTWSRAKKDALVVTINPEWRDLAADWETSGALPPPARGRRRP